MKKINMYQDNEQRSANPLEGKVAQLSLSTENAQLSLSGRAVVTKTTEKVHGTRELENLVPKNNLGYGE